MNIFKKNNNLLIFKQTNLNYNPNNLVLVYNTALGNANNTIYFPVGTPLNSVTVDWGDGSSDVYTTSGYKSHTYSTGGIYTVQVSGKMTTLSHSATIPVAGSKEKLIQCLSFGIIGLTSLNGAFNGCSNLTVVPQNLPSNSTIINLSNAFMFCSNFNQSINDWNVSSVTVMSQMFRGCAIFNQPLNNWNTSNVTSMSSVFDQALMFNQPLNNWNVSKVTNFAYMFNQAVAFNQSLSSWSIGANVATPSINMNYMFSNSSSFNQPLNNWNVNKVTTFNSMFYNADSFDQNLASWNLAGINISTGLTGFMQLATGLSTANYDALLIGWNSNKASYRNDLKPHFGGSKYSSAAASARAELITYGWTITDGGLAP